MTRAFGRPDPQSTIHVMEPCLRRTLSDHRGQICARWEALLRIERVNTPLANPDALVHLFNWTLNQVYSRLDDAHQHEPAAFRQVAVGADPFACDCGRNPFVAYFKAARQALTEALVLEQSRATHLDPLERDREMTALRRTIDDFAQTEVSAFCALCTHRAQAGPPHLEREFGVPAEEG